MATKKVKKTKKVRKPCSEAGSDLRVLRTSKAGKKLASCKKK
jgi:hypothetical protein